MNGINDLHGATLRHAAHKPRYVLVTDPAEIEAVRLENATGALHLPIGDFANGQCWAVAASLERYREALRAAALAAEGRTDG